MLSQAQARLHCPSACLCPNVACMNTKVQLWIARVLGEASLHVWMAGSLCAWSRERANLCSNASPCLQVWTCAVCMSAASLFLDWTWHPGSELPSLPSSRSKVFFTDYGQIPKVERCDMDGQNRTKLVDSKIVFPHGITLDLVNRLVYWADAYLDYIEVVDYEGKNRHTIIQGILVSGARGRSGLGASLQSVLEGHLSLACGEQWFVSFACSFQQIKAVSSRSCTT